MQAIDAEQRRVRLAIRHGLARPFDTVEEAAAELVGLHATDPATVYLAARARVRDFAHADLETALYERRSRGAHARHAAHDVRRPGRPRRGHGRGLYEGARAAAAPAVDRDARRAGRGARRRAMAPPRRARHDGGVARTWRGHRDRAHRVRAGAGEEALVRRGQDVGGAGRRLHPRPVPARDRRRGSCAAAPAVPGFRASTGGRRPTCGSGRRCQPATTTRPPRSSSVAGSAPSGRRP